MALIRAVFWLLLAWAAFELGYRCWLKNKEHPNRAWGFVFGLLYLAFVLGSAVLAYLGVSQFFPVSH